MLTLTPINLKTANAFVQQYHRHHKPTRGHKFSIGVSENGALVGVAICGIPRSTGNGLQQSDHLHSGHGEWQFPESCRVHL